MQLIALIDLCLDPFGRDETSQNQIHWRWQQLAQALQTAIWVVDSRHHGANTLFRLQKPSKFRQDIWLKRNVRVQQQVRVGRSQIGRIGAEAQVGGFPQIFGAALFALILLARRLHRKKRQGFERRPAPDPTTVAAPAPLTRKKPDWVVQEVLRLKALMGKHAGYRKVADTFNRLHAPTRAGKSFVSKTIRNHQYALLNISRDLRNKRPAPVSVNSVWGVDLTFVRDHSGTQRPVMGVVDHGSRVCTRLAAVVNKRSWTLIGHLCLAIGQYGKPHAIRTDYERLIF